MAKFMYVGSYTLQGLQGVMKEGGAARVAALTKLAEGMGGRLESFYFAHGSDDFFVTVELPDTTAALAVSAAIHLSGAVQARTIVLVEPEEVDRARALTVTYRPPGQ